MSTNEPTCELRIDIEADACKATLTIPEGFDPALVTLENLAAVAQAKGIALASEEHELLRRCVDSFAAQPQHLTLTIAYATEAVPGEDGRIEWTDGHDPDHAEAAGEQARDYYSLGAFSRVEEGETVATLHAPTAGVDGHDVLGHALSAKAGKPAPYEFDSGSFRIAGDGIVTALRAGALRVDRGVCSVVDLLEVRGNVDFSTGNIETSGSVCVAQSVKDNFKIVAGKDIEVRGLVEAASLTCGGNLVLRTGMEARQHGVLQVGGDVHAGYLNNVHADIKGDLNLIREAMACDLRVAGNLHGDRAALIGGQIAVAGSIKIGALGSRAEPPTELVVGSLPLLEQELENLRRQVLAARKSLEAISQEEETLGKMLKHLSPQQKERYTVLQFERTERTAEEESALARIGEIERIISERRQVDLQVLQIVHPGVTLMTESQRITTTTTLKGPIRFGWSEDRRLLMHRSTGEWCDAQTVIRAAA